MNARWFLPMILCLLVGCTHNQLRRSTVRTISTLPDVQYRQVLDNLARIASQPGALPYFAVTGSGTAQVTDGVEGSNNLGFDRMGFTSDGLSLGGSRNVSETWNFDTVTSPEKLRAMRDRYHQAMASRRQGGPGGCWFHVGGKWDVPKDACYVGRYRGTYVWVDHGGVACLTELTLDIIDIATQEDSAGGVPELKVYLANPVGSGQLQVPTAPGAPAMGMPEALPPGTAPFVVPPTVPRRNFSGSGRGPIFTPRATN